MRVELSPPHTRDKYTHAVGKGSLEPLASQPAVEELQAGLGLVHWDHVATAVEAHEGEVAVGLNLADLLTNVLVLLNDKILQLGIGELGLAGPLESLRPGLVAEPVADEIGITGVDENGNLLKQARHQAVERLHPVAVEEEVTVDVEVARFVTLSLGADSLPHVLLVEVVADVAHALVAQVGLILALSANIVDVLAGALVRSQESVVTIDRGWDTNPGALAVVARLNHLLATGQSVVHSLAALLVQNSRVATVTAGHWAVVLILSETVGQAVSNKHGLEVDVALLVGQNLRSKGGDVVASVGLSSDVEVLLGVLRELLEEEGHESIDILAGGHSVADSLAAV